MKLQINNTTGEVVLYPVTEPQEKSGYTIVEVSPGLKPVIGKGGPFKWRFDERFTEGGELETIERRVQVPKQVTPLQMRKALNLAGLRETVQSAVNEASQEIQDAWEYATVIERTDPSLNQMAQNLGLDTAAVDALFTQAAKL